MLQRKVCLVGDFAVGKTSLFNRFVYNRFSEQYLSTLGVRVQRKTVELVETTLALILWDIEGGQENQDLRASYIAGAAAAIIVCDLTRVQTIHHMRNYAAALVRCTPNIQLVLAANKADLVAESHPYYDLLCSVANDLMVPVVTTSAQSGSGVETMFQQLGKDLVHEQRVI